LDSRFRVDVEDVRRKITPLTAVIVATAGTSECGAIDDIPALSEIARQYQVPLHVDAAAAGFLIPFGRELGHPFADFGFRLEGVSSIAVDPHKYGYAPIPAGYLLMREVSQLSLLATKSHYQGTADHHTLLGTRPGAALLATYAALLHLGREGYRKITRHLFQSRNDLVRELQRLGLSLAFPPELMILGIRFQTAGRAMAYLQEHGLLTSVSRRHDFLRIVVQQHLTRAHFRRLLRHLDEYSHREESHYAGHVCVDQQAQVVPSRASDRNGNRGNAVESSWAQGSLPRPDVRERRRRGRPSSCDGVPARRRRNFGAKRRFSESARTGNLRPVSAGSS